MEGASECCQNLLDSYKSPRLTSIICWRKAFLTLQSALSVFLVHAHEIWVRAQVRSCAVVCVSSLPAELLVHINFWLHSELLIWHFR